MNRNSLCLIIPCLFLLCSSVYPNVVIKPRTGDKPPEKLSVLIEQRALMFPVGDKDLLLNTFIDVFNYNWAYANYYLPSKRKYIIDYAVKILEKAVNLGTLQDREITYILEHLKNPDPQLRELLMQTRKDQRIAKRSKTIESNILEIRSQINRKITCYGVILTESIHVNCFDRICEYRDMMDGWVSCDEKQPDTHKLSGREKSSRDLINIFCSGNITENLKAFLPLPDTWADYANYYSSNSSRFHNLMTILRIVHDPVIVSHLTVLDARISRLYNSERELDNRHKTIRILLHALSARGYEDMTFQFDHHVYISDEFLRKFQEKCCDNIPSDPERKFYYGQMVFYYRDPALGMRLMLEVAIGADKWSLADQGSVAMSPLLDDLFRAYRALEDKDMVDTIDRLRKGKDMLKAQKILHSQLHRQIGDVQ